MCGHGHILKGAKTESAIALGILPINIYGRPRPLPTLTDPWSAEWPSRSSSSSLSDRHCQPTFCENKLDRRAHFCFVCSTTYVQKVVNEIRLHLWKRLTFQAVRVIIIKNIPRFFPKPWLIWHNQLIGQSTIVSNHSALCKWRSFLKALFWKGTFKTRCFALCAQSFQVLAPYWCPILFSK